MKKLMFSVALASFSCAIGQVQPIVQIDFKSKLVTYPSLEELRSGKTVQIKVVNIPTNNFKVSINKTDSFVSIGTPPALFSVFSYGDGFSGLLASLTGYSIRNAGYLVTTPAAGSGISKTLKIMSLGDGDKEFKAQLPADFLTQIDCGSSVTSIMPIMKKMRDEVIAFHFQFRDQVVKVADNLIYAYNLGTINNLTFKQNAENLINTRLGLEKDIELKYQQYYDVILPQYDIVTRCIPLATADSMLAAYKTGFAHFLNRFDTTFNEVLIAKVYKQLSTPIPSTDFLSLPYTIKGDITKFTIDITGIDVTKFPQSYNTTVELEKYPNRLWAFTTGVFISGLRNDDFSVLTNVRPSLSNPARFDTLNYSIVEENNSGVAAGINALMHFGGYFGSSSQVGGFVSFGPGLTLEKNPQVRVMLGAGLLFGRSNKLALSFGWTGGPVKRLSSNYNTTDTYNPAPVDVTRDKFDGGWFVSLGYALFGK